MIKGKRKIIKKKYEELKLKFDKNKDGLISLDEYLSDELSQGPKAKPSSIDYNYQHYENIYNYFVIEFKKKRKFKILCAPNFVLKYGKSFEYQIRASIIYNFHKDEFYFNDRIVNAVKKCLNQTDIRFIFFGFVLINSSSFADTHANMIIVDLYKKTFERFEPYGYGNLRDEKKIDLRLKEQGKEILGLNKNYKYISPINISPKLGVQSIADAFCGLCVTISMMYLHLRVLNPDISQKKIIKFLVKRDKKDLKTMILKYARHVEVTLKNNKTYIADLMKDFKKKIKELN